MHKFVSITNWTSVTANVAVIVLASALSGLPHIQGTFLPPGYPPIYTAVIQTCASGGG